MNEQGGWGGVEGRVEATGVPCIGVGRAETAASCVRECALILLLLTATTDLRGAQGTGRVWAGSASGGVDDQGRQLLASGVVGPAGGGARRVQGRGSHQPRLASPSAQQ